MPSLSVVADTVECIHVRTYKRIHYRLIINFVRIKHYKYPRFGHWIAQRRNIHPSRGKRINGKSRIFYILKYSRNRKSFMFQKIIQYFLLNMKDLIIAQVLFRFHSQKNFFFIKSVWINKNHFNTIDSRWVLKNYFSNRSSPFDQSIAIKLRESRTINPTRLYARNHTNISIIITYAMRW